jgi:hypothetical protein
MMEAVHTSETSVDNYFTWQHIPEDNSEPGHTSDSAIKTKDLFYGPMISYCECYIRTGSSVSCFALKMETDGLCERAPQCGVIKHKSKGFTYRNSCRFSFLNKDCPTTSEEFCDPGLLSPSFTKYSVLMQLSDA